MGGDVADVAADVCVSATIPLRVEVTMLERSDLYIFRTSSRMDSLIQRANLRFGSLQFEVSGIGFLLLSG